MLSASGSAVRPLLRADVCPCVRPPSPAAIQWSGPGGKCLQPENGSARSMVAVTLTDFGCQDKFAQLPSGAIQHMRSGMCLSGPGGQDPAAGNQLVLSADCQKAPAFQQAPNGAMVHNRSGLCLGLAGGTKTAAEGARVVFSTACTQALRFSLGPFPAAGEHRCLWRCA